MIAKQFLKFFSQTQSLRQSNKIFSNTLFSTPTMRFSNDIKKVKAELQGESPFEINSSRQMMIADQKIIKGELPQKTYSSSSSSRNRTKRGERGERNDRNERIESDNREVREVGHYKSDKKQSKYTESKPKALSKQEVENILPELNNVRNYYQVLDRFTEQNFLDVVMNDKFINESGNALALNNLWTYSRKHRILHSYQTPQFEQITKTISENLDKLQVPESISGFSFNLYKVNYKDVDPYIKIEQHVIQHMEQYPLKALAQIAFSFTSISRSQTTHDFSSFYGKMQLVIALKLRDAIVDPKTDIKQLQKDYSQILSGYSKSQNLSKEFLYVLEQFIVNHITFFEPREKTATLYTFAVNDYYSKTLCEICRDDFLKSFDSFNIQEMSHLLTSLDKFDMLDEEILQLVKQQFLLKKSQVNLLDLADICSVFFKREFVDEEFFTTVRESYRALRQNVDMNVICKMLTNVSSLLNKELMPHRFFKTLLQSLQIVSFQKDLKGRFIDQLKIDGKMILHPQFQQQFMETLDNQRKVDYKQMKTEIKENSKEKKEERVKKHFQIEHKNQQRDERARGQKSENKPRYQRKEHDESD